jgi:quercetin dioxygenase-like cupin family protein
MSTDIFDYITRSRQKTWQPLIENGHHYNGIFVKSLRYDEAAQRSKTILLKFEAGASYPYHNHPAGEELFVLSGEVTVEGAHLTEGDYLYTPPDFKHSVRTNTGCTLLFVVPEEVEILGLRETFLKVL